eukprot:1137556-Pelagomonas_calceolata.AAC.5
MGIWRGISHVPGRQTPPLPRSTGTRPAGPPPSPLIMKWMPGVNHSRKSLHSMHSIFDANDSAFCLGKPKLT